jgi:hypothetical protein
VNGENYILKGLMIVDILTVNMPRKMMETEIVECNEIEKNMDGVFIKSLEEERHLRKHRLCSKDSNKKDLSA